VTGLYLDQRRLARGASSRPKGSEDGSGNPRAIHRLDVAGEEMRCRFLSTTGSVPPRRDSALVYGAADTRRGCCVCHLTSCRVHHRDAVVMCRTTLVVRDEEIIG